MFVYILITDSLEVTLLNSRICRIASRLSILALFIFACQQKQNIPPSAEKPAPVEKQAQTIPAVNDSVKAPLPTDSVNAAFVKSAPVGNKRASRETKSGKPIVSEQVAVQTPVAQPAVQQQATTASIKVALEFSGFAQPGDSVFFDASKSRDLLDTSSQLEFRFDFEGDGVWDYPNNNSFDKKAIVGHKFDNEGIYTVVVQAQAKDRRTAIAEGKLMVRVPPSAAIEIRPALPIAGSLCTLDAHNSTVSTLGKKSFSCRWDLDNNGTWDFPANNGFTSSTIATKHLSGAGPFRVALQIKDEAGLTSKAIAEIPMTPEFKVILLAVPDTALAEIPFTASCQTSYPPSEIAEYDWDFNGDGVYELKQDKPVQQYEFKKNGVYKISCKAIARNGNTAVLSRTITIISRAVVIKPMVPKQSQALVATQFDAEITARHTKVEQISWDFDGDGKYDFSSPVSAKASFAISKAGIVHPVIKVTTTDKREWFDTVALTVSPTQPPKAIAPKSFLSHKGSEVELAGKGVTTAGKIILYEWDFDGDGKYDWKSDKTGTVRHTFVDYAKPVLRVTGESGATATDSLKVVICPQGMIGIKEGPFCIDKYEFPNAKGQVPVQNLAYAEAEAQCKKENKRLCTADEWETACSGTKKQQYPTATSQYTGQVCNSLATNDSPNHISQSGSFEDCVAASGAMDMNGNVAEWVSPQKKGMAYAYGGSWLLPPDKATCSSRLEMNAGQGFPYVGFRCCK